MNPLAEDLDHVLAHTQGLWDELRGQRIFITGGTGFFGCWLLESFTWANDKLGLGASATVLTRNPDAFRKKAPHLVEHPSVRLHCGEIASFSFPEGEYAYVIHAATENDFALDDSRPLAVFESNWLGTRRVLAFAVNAGARRFLITSSGAVYGRQPPELTHIPEEYAGAPDPADPRSAYGEGKRVAETLCAAYAARHPIEPVIARCFAFVGPYLPLDAGYAIGNFIRDVLAGGPVRINGDGTPYRSYLYAADLAVWLWTLLLRGRKLRPYNVGSDAALTITELAQHVVSVAAPADRRTLVAHFPDPTKPAERYVPAVGRAKDELGLQCKIDLRESIQRTCLWHLQVFASSTS